MNLGETLNETGGVRDDLELPSFSVLALELQRNPTFRPGMLYRHYNLSDEQRTARSERLQSMQRKPESRSIESRLLAVLRASTRAGERLSRSEICERAGYKVAGATIGALAYLRGIGAVKTEGQKRGVVYVAVEEKCTTEIAAASS